jgi:regulator of protease activity HflC (stomatin/prohibitin superfamily)
MPAFLILAGVVASIPINRGTKRRTRYGRFAGSYVFHLRRGDFVCHRHDFQRVFSGEDRGSRGDPTHGKFAGVANAEINFKLPWLDQIAGRIDLRAQQLALDVETKTKDNVFVKIPVSVQYHVIPEKVYEAFYKLANPKQQISSYVFNVILGHVPKMILDDAFLQQSDIAVAIKEGLDDVMRTYGYAIDQALVTDIEPDEKVKAAMNEINAAQREQVAASARGEAEKILKVKQAEAEAESKALQGQGIANQRKAIIEGLKQSVEAFSAAVEGTTPKDVMMLVLVTQYLDTMKEIGANDKSNTIFVSHSPAAVGDLFRQMQDAVMIGQKGATVGQ